LGLRTRTAVVRFSLRQLGFLIEPVFKQWYARSVTERIWQNQTDQC